MTETLPALWSIDRFTDNYKTPLAPGSVTWRAGAENVPWPLFHPSEADPDAGYTVHPFAVLFDLREADLDATYELAIAFLVVTARLPFLEVEVNGVTGRAYLATEPSRATRIDFQAGLHTALHAVGEARVVIPGALLRSGANRLVLTARDEGEVVPVVRAEAKKRLDRIASAAGIVYRRIAFGRTEAVTTATVRTTPLWRHASAGLVERCDLVVELARPAPDGLAATLRIGGLDPIPVALPGAVFGHVSTQLDVPDGAGPIAYEVALAGEIVGRGAAARKRKWTVHVAPHAHTDIGYTHRQAEVAERQAQNIDRALAIRGAYHLDSTWPLEEWLATRSEHRRASLKEALAAGTIGAAANWVDLLTHHAALEDLIRNVELGARLVEGASEGTVRASFAAFVDVASLTSALPDVLAGAGVRWLVHANNQDRGPFRVNGRLHERSPYVWRGPGGGEVIVWLSKMYCELRKVCGSPPVVASAERGLAMWLDEYDRPDYVLDTVLMYGLEADNTDLDPQPYDFVGRWNATWAYPRLVPCEPSAFFRAVEDHRAAGGQLPVVRGDGGAYWEDGVGSTMEASARARSAQATLVAAERLAALACVHHAGLAFPAARFEEAWRSLLLWEEHTWGAFLSCREPEALLQHDQWETKESFVRAADEAARGLLLAAGTRHALSWSNDGREVVVFNPHGFPAAGPVTVEIEPDERPVHAGSGAPSRVLRALATQSIVELWVEELPAFGYRRYVLERAAGRSTSPPTTTVDGIVTLESPHYLLTIDATRGVATSLVDRATGRELVDARDAWGFGALVRATGGEGTRIVSNAADLPAADLALDASFAASDASLSVFPGGTSITIRGATPAGPLAVTWTLRDGARVVELAFVWEKVETLAKEGAYVALPFAMPPAARVASDAQLGWVTWGEDDLPGACKEWLPLQSAVLVRGGEGAGDVLVASPDVPLFCIGDVVRGAWPVTKEQTGGRLFSYVLNNYWDTNYKASQGGRLTFRYAITSGAAIDLAAAHRFGSSARRPLHAQRMSFQDFRAPGAPYADPAGGALAEVASGGDGIVVSTLRPGKGGLLARLVDTSGSGGEARLAFPGRRIASAVETDLLGRDVIRPIDVEDGWVAVDVGPWAMLTLRIALEEPAG